MLREGKSASAALRVLTHWSKEDRGGFLRLVPYGPDWYQHKQLSRRVMAMAEQGLSTDSSVSIHDLPSADREVEIVEGDHAYLDEDTQNDQHTLHLNPKNPKP